ncbi:MAG: hypothetical protein FJX73_04575 [Armatimonadetes bacterium]|nr:hypothetical protein [Armatimonadota bacterium]
MRRILLVSIAVLLAIAPAAWANDTSFGASGSAYPGPRPSKDIRMVSEAVHARIVRDKMGGYARVACRFVLRNEGPRQRIRIGFPEDTGGDIPERGLIRRFTSTVNGRPVGVSRVVLTSDGDRGGFFIWWMKDVTFDAGETKQVQNDYEVALSGNVEGVAWFTYILSTGANWKGRIGEATLVVDLGSISPRQVIGLGTKPRKDHHREFLIRPSGAKIEGTRLIWRLKDFEPTQRDNIMVAWYSH